MGRNNKTELQYFPVDVDILRDKKVRRLTRKYERGAEFYLYLLCAIYSDKGYYLPVDSQTAFDIADDLRITEDEVQDMIEFCLSDNVGLFSRKMMDKYSILTSRGIQTRYAETIRQLKRKLNITSEFSLLSEEETGIYSEIVRNIRKNSEEKPIYSEEMRIYSDEMGITSEKTAISSDKSKVEESKVKENKKEEIYLSASEDKERENFLKILLFEKNMLDPQSELDRFCAHYEKTGWVDANGNAIKNRSAALKAWMPDKNAPKCPQQAAKIWEEIYTRIAADGEDCTPMLRYFRGIYADGQKIQIVCADKALSVFLEHPQRIGVLREVLAKHFGDKMLLHYQIPRL